ncbi:MAG: AraC family transcriptional regulator [Bacteroidetes bacterium HGW-Bacteroidetes-17]|jgi:AraC-like DNA-binding protein|nr:MAG: AraC family transcriptional regulator [Bacteroidetes bacterium HGW-Bacteroidetes-17]
MNQDIIDKTLLIGASLTLFLAFLHFRKKGKALHDYIISGWLIFLGLYISVYAFSPSGFFIHLPWLINLYISLLFLNGPLLYLYVKAITNSEYKLGKSISWHLIPFILFTLYLNILFTARDILMNISSFNGDAEIDLPLPYFIFFILLALSVPFYILLSVRLLHKHKKIIADNFSDLKKRTLSWLRILIIVLGIVWIILASIIFIHHVLLLFSDSFCINGLFITLSAFIVLAGYFGLYQPQIFTSQNTVISTVIEEKEKPYSGSSLKEDNKQKYLAFLNEYMNNNKPYMDSELTLHQLAIEVNIPLHHLSRIINEYFNQNFFDYINQFRVNEFIRRLPDQKYSNYSLLAIAFDCGFNSKTTFNRYFKKAIGLTPSQYKNKFSD